LGGRSGGAVDARPQQSLFRRSRNCFLNTNTKQRKQQPRAGRAPTFPSSSSPPLSFFFFLVEGASPLASSSPSRFFLSFFSFLPSPSPPLSFFFCLGLAAGQGAGE
jgi:hypothetical protein